MTDILVRVPMSEADHFWKENDATIEWWTLGRKPAHFLSGDFIFFALGENVVAYAGGQTYLQSGGSLLHSDDGRDWRGEHVVWKAEAFHKIEPSISLRTIGLQVPRGFAYCGHTQLRSLVARSRGCDGCQHLERHSAYSGSCTHPATTARREAPDRKPFDGNHIGALDLTVRARVSPEWCPLPGGLK